MYVMCIVYYFYLDIHMLSENLSELEKCSGQLGFHCILLSCKE